MSNDRGAGTGKQSLLEKEAKKISKNGRKALTGERGRRALHMELTVQLINFSFFFLYFLLYLLLHFKSLILKKKKKVKMT